MISLKDSRSGARAASAGKAFGVQCECPTKKKSYFSKLQICLTKLLGFMNQTNLLMSLSKINSLFKSHYS